jgi:hypothetical protein
MIAPASVIDIAIRACEEENVAPVTRIYAHHVLHGLASFEVEPPSETEMPQRCREVIGRWVDSVLMHRALGAGDSTPP